MTCVSGLDPSDGGKTGGNAQSQIFEHPEDAERIMMMMPFFCSCRNKK